jgi:catechol 2,3-dioxygenase-like lactoylglutathione lyase family enzyme
MRRQIDHVTVRVNDGGAADAFYRPTLHELGFERAVDDHGRVSFGTDEGHQFGFYSGGDEFYKQARVAFAALLEAPWTVSIGPPSRRWRVGRRAAGQARIRWPVLGIRQ